MVLLPDTEDDMEVAPGVEATVFQKALLRNNDLINKPGRQAGLHTKRK